MRTLFIDLASHEKCFALVDDAKVIALTSPEDAKAEEELMPEIESLLQKAGWSYTDLNRIACVTGPGGFMSLRVGVSLANALSYALKIPAAGVHLSDIWAQRVRSGQPFEDPEGLSGPNGKAEGSNFVWVHSTKKTHLFVRGFGTYAKFWPKAQLMPIEDVAASKDRPARVGELISEHQEALKKWDRCASVAPVAGVLPSFLRSLTYDRQTLVPWYGRGV